MRWKGLVVVLGVFALIPATAATGLSLPLPAAVERIAAVLVPWVESATSSEQPIALGASGSIVLTSSERTGGAPAVPRATPRPQLNRPATNGGATPALEPQARAAGPTAPAADAPVPTGRVKPTPERSGAEPGSSPPILTSSEPPRSVVPEPRSDSAVLPKVDPGPLPPSVPEPVPTAPAPVQQTVGQTLTTVAATTQTIVDNTVPAQSETVQPVTAIVANPVGAVGGLVPALGLGRKK